VSGDARRADGKERGAAGKGPAPRRALRHRAPDRDEAPAFAKMGAAGSP
jgi:hypothetical protein